MSLHDAQAEIGELKLENFQLKRRLQRYEQQMWSVGDVDYAMVREYLQYVKITKPDVVEVLIQNEIDFDALKICEAEDLAEMNLSKGSQVKIHRGGPGQTGPREWEAKKIGEKIAKKRKKLAKRNAELAKLEGEEHDKAEMELEILYDKIGQLQVRLEGLNQDIDAHIFRTSYPPVR